MKSLLLYKLLQHIPLILKLSVKTLIIMRISMIKYTHFTDSTIKFEK